MPDADSHIQSQTTSFHRELEHGQPVPTEGLYNDTVHVYRWEGLNAVLPGKKGGDPKHLLKDMAGEAQAGELVAIMGPSGSGKTMLLNRLAHRAMPPKAKLDGTAYINDVPANISSIRATSSYVEQQDHLIGSLTTSETMKFAAKLGLNERISRQELQCRIDKLIAAFGLTDQANLIIGTPIQKGLSGGQKRRVSVASQLITAPKILFLDEPTSGLDSVASYEVISYLKAIAKENKLVVIASIHQPSTTTFKLFDKVYLLGKGQLCYGGPINTLESYFKTLDFVLPPSTNPAEWILELVDIDFARDKAEGAARLHKIVEGWKNVGSKTIGGMIEHNGAHRGLDLPTSSARRKIFHPLYLLQRSWIKSYRDLIAYWIRVGMYTCLAILVGTCWLRLGHTQFDVQPRVTALFFGGAFLSFMAVAYIPAYIEDQATFFKERANGLYGPTSFLVANFLIGLPYLFIIATIFSVIAYWLVNLWPTAIGFWTFVGFLFLDLMAAESLIVLISSIVPNFIVALALSAFANGLWMCVNGFLVPETVLNVFWKSWVTKIDYQNWVFRAMMWNEFHAQTFTCANLNNCAFPPNPDGLTIAGKSVLSFYGYDSGALGAFGGYILAIIAAYRLLAWVVLYIRR